MKSDFAASCNTGAVSNFLIILIFSIIDRNYPQLYCKWREIYSNVSEVPWGSRRVIIYDLIETTPSLHSIELETTLDNLRLHLMIKCTESEVRVWPNEINVAGEIENSTVCDSFSSDVHVQYAKFAIHPTRLQCFTFRGVLSQIATNLCKNVNFWFSLFFRGRKPLSS